MYHKLLAHKLYYALNTRVKLKGAFYIAFKRAVKSLNLSKSCKNKFDNWSTLCTDNSLECPVFNSFESRVFNFSPNIPPKKSKF